MALHRTILRASALSTCALLVGSPITAQTPRDGPAGEPPLMLARSAGPIEPDGEIGASEWAGAVEIVGLMHLPDFGAEPTERTEFLLAYDDDYLYVGCRAYDSEPERIRVTTLERDVAIFNTDACGIRLDTYNDEENSLLFNATPASVRTDWTFANDASGAPNQDWNAFWDASGRMTDYGWSVEMRIPFSSLGFQVVDGRTVMGFALARSIVRKNELSVHPAIPPNWGPQSLAKPSQMRKMILEGVEPEHPVYVTPYGLGGAGYTHALNGPGDAYDRDDDRVTEAGVDIRYGLTRNLNLDLTANTDFAQVEADGQQVNLTRFSLFFPEKRRFFQERAAIFEVSLGGNERLFHSRTIGLVNREQVRIFGGARVVGRIGEWDVGFIDLQTDEHGLTPSENLGVLRLRRRVLNQFSYLGGILTSRLGEGGRHNVVSGADAAVRLFGQDYLTLDWALSFDDADGPGVEVLDRSLARLNWQRRGTDGLLYSTNIVRAGAVFEPGMGFLRRRDYLSADGQVGYGWRPGGGSALNRYGAYVAAEIFRRNADEEVESGAYAAGGDLESRGGHRAALNLTRRYEDLPAPFALSPTAFVPVGAYWFLEASASYTPPSGALFRPGLNVSGGQFYDGNRMSFTVSPTWSLSRHVALGGAYELNRIRFDDRDQEFTSHIGRLRTDLTFTTRTSASAFAQYNSAGDVIVLNFRFRYNPSEGTDLYVVWNESLNSDRYAVDPYKPLSQERTLLIKYARTFALGL